MLKRRTVLAAAAAVALAGSAQAQQQRIPIEMWIGLTGPAQEELIRYGKEFNDSQDRYQANVSFRGQYPEQRAAAFAAFRAGNPPHIMQMFDAGTGDMFGLPRATVPVSEVFQRAGLKFDPTIFLGPARGYYSRPDGTLNSLPLNVSTAVMFYNKDIFKKAGLDPNKPPQTWPETIEAAKKIRATNAAECGLTNTWLAWIMLEQFSAMHDLPLSDQANGRAGLNAVLKFNDAPRVKMVQTLVDMAKDRSYQYGGRSNDANALFVAGTCGMLLQSSGGHAAIERDLKAEFGVSYLPYWPDIIKEPKNSIVGGASLWVFNSPKRTEEEFRGIAQFLDFLAQPERLARFAMTTGFLPATNAAWEVMKKQDFFSKNPGRDIPIEQLTRGTPTENSAGYRFGRWTEIRDFYHEEVERALQGQQTAQQALDNAVRRGNEALRQFERTAQTN
ncbi:MAG TPA: extracellular solute-binding protein [Beijerinckiaceae bacterium]|nr:extracellular solute-binding protein [Beijerinckiaceae bacterium]